MRLRKGQVCEVSAEDPDADEDAPGTKTVQHVVIDAFAPRLVTVLGPDGASVKAADSCWPICIEATQIVRLRGVDAHRDLHSRTAARLLQ
jgi:hypothetical protein